SWIPDLCPRSRTRRLSYAPARGGTHGGGRPRGRRGAGRARSVPCPAASARFLAAGVRSPALARVFANQLLAGPLRQPPRHRHGSKKEYLSPRIYNALRRKAGTLEPAGCGPTELPEEPADLEAAGRHVRAALRREAGNEDRKSVV